MDQELQSLRDTIRMDIAYLESALQPLGSRNLRQASRTSLAIRHGYEALTALRRVEDDLYAVSQYGDSGNAPLGRYHVEHLSNGYTRVYDRVSGITTLVTVEGITTHCRYTGRESTTYKVHGQYNEQVATDVREAAISFYRDR